MAGSATEPGTPEGSSVEDDVAELMGDMGLSFTVVLTEAAAGGDE